MVIFKNALRERIRRKELYIVAGITLLLLFLCGSGSATLSIDGKPITDFENMLGVMHIIGNFASCMLAVVLSMKTIPNEYERKTSHLVWIRGITQSRYHFSLAGANVASAVYSAAVLYLGIGVYTIAKGRADCLWRMVPAFLILCVNVILISILVSAFSIVLPAFAVGLIGSVYVLVGAFHGILEVYGSVIGGFSRILIKRLLWLVPDINGIQAQAKQLILGEGVNLHLILTGLLACYVFSLCFWILKRKEA